ncbi:heat stress transcription factor C-1-like [Cucurbita maxima]|uniref:Heat stress transcription factor C-1-like n=1 Tax=Cucurbita maxima TaxID=3661 RepID=A0A6J1JJX7_CUCMA|nr:heat stress transcription factor C-1-like [Cucurbita maxima]
MEVNCGNDIVAPFILKTYQMVNDPLTDTSITWGSANNSFVVLDPLYFSHTLLPAFFKHNNFSSFIRQLNTYGFRKVDPDRWEFANEWFLRGQYHLLRNIVRRKHCSNSAVKLVGVGGDMSDEDLVSEIGRLRKEQRALEHQLQAMKKRLETTEKRPHQMMAFLHKVVEDPEILPRIMLHRDPTHRFQIPDKKRRFMTSPSSSSPSTASFDTDEIEDDPTRPEVSGPWFLEDPAAFGVPAVAPMDIGISSSGGEMKYLTEMTVGAVEESRPPPPYPFSLFGCGF